MAAGISAGFDAVESLRAGRIQSIRGGEGKSAVGTEDIGCDGCPLIERERKTGAGENVIGDAGLAVAALENQIGTGKRDTRKSGRIHRHGGRGEAHGRIVEKEGLDDGIGAVRGVSGQGDGAAEKELVDVGQARAFVHDVLGGLAIGGSERKSEDARVVKLVGTDDGEVMVVRIRNAERNGGDGIGTETAIDAGGAIGGELAAQVGQFDPAGIRRSHQIREDTEGRQDILKNRTGAAEIDDVVAFDANSFILEVAIAVVIEI